MTRRNVTIACAALALVSLAACGGDSSSGAPDGSSSASGDPTSLTVVARDISFPEASYRVQAGAVDITYENDGSIVHTLVIEGVNGFKLEVRGNGDVDEGSVELAPGEYVLYCDIPGHREAGMEATLDVG